MQNEGYRTVEREAWFSEILFVKSGSNMGGLVKDDSSWRSILMKTLFLVWSIQARS